jgi:hypothetical protein
VEVTPTTRKAEPLFDILYREVFGTTLGLQKPHETSP